MSGIYPGINSIGAFREHSYASICSLNFPEKGNVYTVSVLDTEQTPASIEFIAGVSSSIVAARVQSFLSPQKKTTGHAARLSVPFKK
jgi:hypothetical protein